MGRKHGSGSRRTFLGALAAAFGMAVAGCGGGGGDDTRFVGSYSARLDTAHNRIVVLTLSVNDRAGASTGNLYVYREDQPDARGRHGGNHAFIASGPVTGRVDPQTRAMLLTGTVTDTDGLGGTMAAEMTGTLKKSVAEPGSIRVTLDALAFTGVFQ